MLDSQKASKMKMRLRLTVFEILLTLAIISIYHQGHSEKLL